MLSQVTDQTLTEVFIVCKLEDNSQFEHHCTAVVSALTQRGPFFRGSNNIDPDNLVFFPEIILLLCANKNDLCFLKKTFLKKSRNTMLKIPRSVEKKKTLNIFDKNLQFHRGLIILSESDVLHKIYLEE